MFWPRVKYREILRYFIYKMVLRCFQWNPSLHLWITDEDENGDFRANDNDWLIRVLPSAFLQCLWEGKNHGLTRPGPGVGPKGCNRRHIIDYQALKVQHDQLQTSNM